DVGGGPGGDAGEQVGFVLLVRRQQREVDLHLVHEPLGEQRPQRPVDEARGEDFLGAGPALALDDPAGELAGGGAALAVVDLDWEEVDALAPAAPHAAGDSDRGALLV